MISKSYLGNEQFIWESVAGSSHFTVKRDTEMEHGELRRGTKVICYMHDDLTEHLEEETLEEMIFQHSDTITFPIGVGTWHKESRGQKRFWSQAQGI